MSDADEVTFGLRLTGPELKVTHTALRSLLDDLGRAEASEREIIRRVLAKLPDEHTMRAMRLPETS